MSYIYYNGKRMTIDQMNRRKWFRKKRTSIALILVSISIAVTAALILL